MVRDSRCHRNLHGRKASRRRADDAECPPVSRLMKAMHAAARGRSYRHGSAMAGQRPFPPGGVDIYLPRSASAATVGIADRGRLRTGCSCRSTARLMPSLRWGMSEAFIVLGETHAEAERDPGCGYPASLRPRPSSQPRNAARATARTRRPPCSALKACQPSAALSAPMPYVSVRIRYPPSCARGRLRGRGDIIPCCRRQNEVLRAFPSDAQAAAAGLAAIEAASGELVNMPRNSSEKSKCAMPGAARAWS
jgi:hypothetical protein